MEKTALGGEKDTYKGSEASMASDVQGKARRWVWPEQEWTMRVVVEVREVRRR